MLCKLFAVGSPDCESFRDDATFPIKMDVEPTQYFATSCTNTDRSSDFLQHRGRLENLKELISQDGWSQAAVCSQ
jgi:hypothetical protein